MHHRRVWATPRVLPGFTCIWWYVCALQPAPFTELSDASWVLPTLAVTAPCVSYGFHDGILCLMLWSGLMFPHRGCVHVGFVWHQQGPLAHTECAVA